MYSCEKLLCRYNTTEYLKNLEFVKIINSKNIDSEYEKFKDYNYGTVIAFIDDPFKSTCFSSYNYKNFLNLDNIELCIAENWRDDSNIKLKMWPIGLESKMVINKKYILEKKYENEPHYENKILCNAHLATYSKPRSGLLDDRKDMIDNVKYNERIDFWTEKKEQDITFEETSKYKYNLCPEGNGIDTHRFYESYFLNVKPIVKKGFLTPLHSQFRGTVVLDKWEDINKIIIDNNTKNNNNLEMITLGYWLYKSLRNKCRIVNFITEGSCKLWKNFLYTIRKLGLEDLLVVFTLDIESYYFVNKENVNKKITVYGDFMYSNLAKDSHHKTKEYRDLMAQKITCIVKILQQNYIVFYLDVDIVVLKDPIQHYFTLPFKKIYMQSDNVHFNYNVSNYCAGVMIIQPCKDIIKIFKDIQKECITREVATMDDQGVINDYIKNNIIDKNDVGILDPVLYPNGHRYFSTNYYEKNKVDVYLIHNNFIVGNITKINRFKKYNFWYISDDKEEEIVVKKPKKKVAVCFWGITRSLKYTIETIKERILNMLENNNIDYKVFIHTYSVHGIYNNSWSKETNIVLDNDEYKLLEADFIEIENENDVRKKINFNEYRSKRDPWKNNYDCVDHFIYCLYSKQKVTQMVKNSGENFDYILYFRPDVYYLNDFQTSYLDLISDDKLIIPNFHVYNGINDRFFGCNNKNYEIFGNMFNDLLEYSKQYPAHAETFYSRMIEKRNMYVIHIPFHFTRIRANGCDSLDCGKLNYEQMGFSCKYDKDKKKCSCLSQTVNF
jgi:hypothetical protein